MYQSLMLHYASIFNASMADRNVCFPSNINYTKLLSTTLTKQSLLHFHNQ